MQNERNLTHTTCCSKVIFLTDKITHQNGTRKVLLAYLPAERKTETIAQSINIFMEFMPRNIIDLLFL
jgi:hypothetical protein